MSSTVDTIPVPLAHAADYGHVSAEDAQAGGASFVSKFLHSLSSACVAGRQLSWEFRWFRGHAMSTDNQLDFLPGSLDLSSDGSYFHALRVHGKNGLDLIVSQTVVLNGLADGVVRSRFSSIHDRPFLKKGLLLVGSG